MDDDLILAHGEVASLMPFLHLPVQSGSDRILKKMNRHHEVADYRRIIDKLLIQRPELKLSSDFIIGFPGETDAEFESTLKLVREIKFLQSYSFKYSPRPGTPGALMGDEVPEHIKSERLSVLQDLLVQHQTAFNQKSVGTMMPVLFDRRGRKANQIVGRSPFMQPVHVKASNEYFGQIVDVSLLDATSNSLSGEVVLNDKAKNFLNNVSFNTESNCV
jgi:tRNA-2-methylthio-N6-dimethylallyladenosine synthase